jgi:SAM-dependent methyltransferase
VNNKKKVHDFWSISSCGEDMYLLGHGRAGYDAHAKSRYDLEGDLIFPFAKFFESKDLDVLEIGVGLGADHQKFAEAGAKLSGIDLTQKSINHTLRRFSLCGLTSNLSVGDAENLNFTNETFDVVYSWGVLHHSPDTLKAISEVFRVLRFGGNARIMIYNKWSIVGYILWCRYALLRFKPWTSMDEIYSKFLESPGTKAYSIPEARDLFLKIGFVDINISTLLGHGDLLESDVGQRHRGLALSIIRFIWPRWFFRLFMPNFGLFMLIEAKKQI